MALFQNILCVAFTIKTKRKVGREGESERNCSKTCVYISPQFKLVEDDVSMVVSSSLSSFI